MGTWIRKIPGWSGEIRPDFPDPKEPEIRVPIPSLAVRSPNIFFLLARIYLFVDQKSWGVEFFEQNKSHSGDQSLT